MKVSVKKPDNEIIAMLMRDNERLRAENESLLAIIEKLNAKTLSRSSLGANNMWSAPKPETGSSEEPSRKIGNNF